MVACVFLPHPTQSHPNPTSNPPYSVLPTGTPNSTLVNWQCTYCHAANPFQTYHHAHHRPALKCPILFQPSLAEPSAPIALANSLYIPASLSFFQCSSKEDRRDQTNAFLVILCLLFLVLRLSLTLPSWSPACNLYHCPLLVPTQPCLCQQVLSTVLSLLLVEVSVRGYRRYCKVLKGVYRNCKVL